MYDLNHREHPNYRQNLSNYEERTVSFISLLRAEKNWCLRRLLTLGRVCFTAIDTMQNTSDCNSEKYITILPFAIVPMKCMTRKESNGTCCFVNFYVQISIH